jgi:hypothetical protein
MPGTPIGSMLAHARDLLFRPLEMRIEHLETSRRRVEATMDDLATARWTQRELKAIDHMRETLREQLKLELTRSLPSVDQVEALHATLSSHVQRLPAIVAYPHGRWTWTRGRLKSAGGRAQPPLVPWTNEKFNSSPSTFGWVGDRAHIEVLASGMYVVSCAVFVPGAPTIGVTVNGQTVLRRVSSSRQVVDSSGLVAGSSLRDVLSLSPGARVAIQCEVAPASGGAAMHDAHGLLEIKKLW